MNTNFELDLNPAPHRLAKWGKLAHAPEDFIQNMIDNEGFGNVGAVLRAIDSRLKLATKK